MKQIKLHARAIYNKKEEFGRLDPRLTVKKRLHMTDKIKKTYKTYFALSLMLALALAVLRTIAVLRHYDIATGYFDEGHLLSQLTNLLTLLALPLCLSVPMTLGGDKLRIPPARFHLLSAFSSALVAFLLIAFAALHVTEITAEVRADAPTSPRVVLTSAVSAILSVLGAVSFILTASMGAEVSAKKAFSSSSVVLFAIVYALFLYFDGELPINAPEKLLAQVTLLSVALFFLYETRVALGQPMPAVRAGLGFLALVLTVSSSIPNLIYYAVNRAALLETPVHDFLILSFALYLVARLSAVLPSGGTDATPFFDAELAGEEESVSSVGQISFFTSDPSPAPAPDTSVLLSSKLGEASGDPESDEAKLLFGAPEESKPDEALPEGDLLDSIAEDLLGPIDGGKGGQA